MRRLHRALMLPFASRDATFDYTNNAIAMAPIAYWPQAEASGQVMTDASGNGRNGAYAASGITLGVAGIGDGRTAALYSAAYGNLYSASLASAFNGQEVCFAAWYKVSAVGVWTDAVLRRLASFRVDASNWVLPYRNTVNNQLVYSYQAGGTSKSVALDGVSTTDWFHLAMRVSKSGDYYQALFNGCQTGALQTGLGTFAGSLANNLTTLAAGDIGAGNPWSGSVAHAIVFNSPNTTADVAILARCNGHATFDGDSRLASNVVPAGVMADSAVIARRFGYFNAATSGDTVAQMIIDAPTQVDPLYRATLPSNIVCAWSGINDASAGASAATIWSRLQTYCNARRAAGHKVVLCTEIDCQSAALNAADWHTTLWAAVNALIVAGWPTCADKLADLGANVNLQDATNTTYFNADKIHLTATGSVVAAGIIAAQLALF